MKKLDTDFIEATLPAMDLVYNLARRCTHTHEEAEDLVQQTYLNALRAWRSHRRPDKAEPWLATICLNIVRSDYRRRRRRPDELLQADPGLEKSSDDDTALKAVAAVEAEAIHAALLQLPEEQRIAVTLADLCGLTAAEVSGVTGSPRGTVLSRIHRGRKALAGKLIATKVNELEP